MTDKRILISTDILGMFGDIEILQKLYGNEFRYLEMITWAPTLDKQIIQGLKTGYEIVRLHGRLFSPKHPELGVDSLMLYAGNFFLKSTPQLLKSYAQNYDILLHTPVFDDQATIHFAGRYKESIKQLWLENHGFGELGVERALHIAGLLQDEGVNAGICFDLAHFIGSKNLQNSDFSGHWYRLLDFLTNRMLTAKNKQGNLIPLSLHFPIGAEPGDSLPVLDKMTDNMLTDLTSIIKNSRIALVTLENQQIGRQSYIKIDERAIDKIAERNKRILEKLSKSGVI